MSSDMKKPVMLVCAVLSVLSLCPTKAAAGLYSDELVKCLVRSMTVSEKNVPIKWVFAAAALHPEVRGIASVTEAQREEMSKATGKLFCGAEFSEAQADSQPCS